MKLLTRISLVGCLFLGANVVIADEFTQETVDEAHAEFMSAVEKGRGLFVDPNLGSNGIVCAQCHPNGANTHPETYPKFQKQLGKVAPMWEMVNWCIRNPLEGLDLDAEDPDMTAIQAYIHYERRGVALAPGKK